MSALLEVSALTKRFGGLVAVNNVSFAVRDKEILSVIGPNGAGKSTLFKLVPSFLRPSSGEVRFRGDRVSGLSPHIVARKGVVRTFQETTIFRGMSVRDNVIIAHHLRSTASLAGFFFGTAAARRDQAAFAEPADKIFSFLGLGSIPEQNRQQPASRPFARLGDRNRFGDPAGGAAARRAVRGHKSRRDDARRRNGPRGARPRGHGAASSTTCRP